MIITVIVTTSYIYLCEIMNVPAQRTRMEAVMQLFYSLNKFFVGVRKSYFISSLLLLRIKPQLWNFWCSSILLLM